MIYFVQLLGCNQQALVAFSTAAAAALAVVVSTRFPNATTAHNVAQTRFLGAARIALSAKHAIAVARALFVGSALRLRFALARNRVCRHRHDSRRAIANKRRDATHTVAHTAVVAERTVAGSLTDGLAVNVATRAQAVVAIVVLARERFGVGTHHARHCGGDDCDDDKNGKQHDWIVGCLTVGLARVL